MGSINNIQNDQENDLNAVYYGVHIPYDVQVEHNDESTVYQDKADALKLIKKYKQARFKAFNSYHEAIEFAINGLENHNKSTLCENQTTKDTNVGEKPPAFRGPKSQDLVKLRRHIEAGLLDIVSACIWENPRYLISSGDTPSILQEGSRYNALHVAAKSKNRKMCELILNTVSDTNFIKLLYGDDCHQDAYERAQVLLDLYLNTPDKGLNETPLHFATKFGAVDVVELLVSYSQCDKTLLNKYGKTASMIICDRYDSSSPHLKNKIAMLLDNNFYVPVLRSEDNCIPPVIGEPFSPSSPLNLSNNFFGSKVEIHAYAGPMDREHAEKFRRAWKTPPRSLKSVSSVLSLKFDDLEKGVEKLGKNLSLQFDVGWREYWGFLDEFADLSSSDGLQILDNFLSERFKTTSVPMADDDDDSNCFVANLECETETSPMSELCKNFARCSLSDSLTECKAKSPKTDFVNQHNFLSDDQLSKLDLNPLLYVEKSCQVFAHRITNDILHLLEDNNTPVLLHTQVKQLQLLIRSFMGDKRFEKVNFRLVHNRLGLLIGRKLKHLIGLPFQYDYVKNTLDYWLELFNKQIDNFSSDDESAHYQQNRAISEKQASCNHHVYCMLDCILNSFVTLEKEATRILDDEEDYVTMWNDAKPCSCSWYSQKNYALKKRNSFKYTSRNLAKSVFDVEMSPCEVDGVKKLEDSVDVKDSDEEYYTPPNSPKKCQSDEEDVFEDCALSDRDVFIEGNIPTKTDYEVYNVVKLSNNILNPRDYPWVYKWFHRVSLFSNHDRKSWPCSRLGKCTVESPSKNKCAQNNSPFKSSWLRVTGNNSPCSTLKHHSRKSTSFN